MVHAKEQRGPIYHTLCLSVYLFICLSVCVSLSLMYVVHYQDDRVCTLPWFTSLYERQTVSARHSCSFKVNIVFLKQKQSSWLSQFQYSVQQSKVTKAVGRASLHQNCRLLLTLHEEWFDQIIWRSFQERHLCHKCYASRLKWVYCKRKEFFPFRVDLFSEGASRAVKETGSHKSYLTMCVLCLVCLYLVLWTCRLASHLATCFCLILVLFFLCVALWLFAASFFFYVLSSLFIVVSTIVIILLVKKEFVSLFYFGPC